MARFRLTAKHYLNIPGTEWIHEETSRETGKRLRKVFHVPTHLDPDEPSDCNYPIRVEPKYRNEIIVATEESKEYPADYIFSGDPTPDMEPLDEAAEAIVEKVRHKWIHPIETLPSQGLSPGEQAFVDAFAKQVTSLTQGQNVSGVSVAKFEELQAQVAELLAQNEAFRKRLETPAASRRA